MAQTLLKAAGMKAILLALAIFAAPACLASDSYDDSWGEEALSDGKADGLYDQATLMEFGQTVRGSLLTGQLAVYAIDLKEGDEFRAVQVVERGDLAPHFTLYGGSSGSVRSKTFELAGKTLTKTYVAPSTGRYLVGVRAYQDRGTGTFALTATCTGGACAGELVLRDLTFDERNACINDALDCSIATLPSFGTAVGSVRARQIFNSCLANSAVLEVSCLNACDDDASTRDLCDSMIGILPLLADHGGACMGELTYCLDECRELEDNVDISDEISDTTAGVCWRDGMNSTCDSYARSLDVCGGEVEADTTASCEALCEATTGAWVDALDDLCTDQCR